jgi:hypothetical protein
MSRLTSAATGFLIGVAGLEHAFVEPHLQVLVNGHYQPHWQRAYHNLVRCGWSLSFHAIWHAANT